jgi:hypothetical protein
MNVSKKDDGQIRQKGFEDEINRHARTAGLLPARFVGRHSFKIQRTIF